MSQTELFVSPDDDMVSGATVSDDYLYRYNLWRTWDRSKGSLVWIMLNPSTADADVDDPTIRRCMSFARREGFGGIEVLNLYALRATKPTHLLDHPDPEGPDNVEVWHSILGPAHRTVVYAWGAGGSMGGLPGSHAWASFMDHMRDAHDYCLVKSLGITKAGHPRHPLYVRADQPMDRWGER